MTSEKHNAVDVKQFTVALKYVKSKIFLRNLLKKRKKLT